MGQIIVLGCVFFFFFRSLRLPRNRSVSSCPDRARFSHFLPLTGLWQKILWREKCLPWAKSLFWDVIFLFFVLYVFSEIAFRIRFFRFSYNSRAYEENFNFWVVQNMWLKLPDVLMEAFFSILSGANVRRKRVSIHVRFLVCKSKYAIQAIGCIFFYSGIPSRHSPLFCQ